VTELTFRFRSVWRLGGLRISYFFRVAVRLDSASGLCSLQKVERNRSMGFSRDLASRKLRNTKRTDEGGVEMALVLDENPMKRCDKLGVKRGFAVAES
jgi:hypothetical protein